MASISVTVSDAQTKAIELLKNDNDATVASIVKAQVQSFANGQIRTALQNAIHGGGGQRDADGNQVITQVTDDEALVLFTAQFLS